MMPALQIGLIVVIALVAVAGAMLWRLLGRLVVEYAKMEADERIDDNAPAPTTAASRPRGGPETRGHAPR